MKKVFALLTLLAAVAVAGVAASPANAVEFGEPDTANAYPWVGLMVAVDEDGDPLWRCTGSLIEPNLFLTAGHCVSDPSAEGGDPVDSIRIWFTDGAEIINTDPKYLANLAAGAEDLCAGVQGYPWRRLLRRRHAGGAVRVDGAADGAADVRPRPCPNHPVGRGRDSSHDVRHGRSGRLPE